MTGKRCEVPFENGDVLKLDSGNGCTTLCMYQNPVNYILYMEDYMAH
jgi:hypothetical protein